MGLIIEDKGVQRELVKVACKPHPGNDSGFYTTYRDAMGPDDVIFGEKSAKAPEPESVALEAEEPDAETEDEASAPIRRGPGRPRKDEG